MTTGQSTEPHRIYQCEGPAGLLDDMAGEELRQMRHLQKKHWTYRFRSLLPSAISNFICAQNQHHGQVHVECSRHQLPRELNLQFIWGNETEWLRPVLSRLARLPGKGFEFYARQTRASVGKPPEVPTKKRKEICLP